MKTYMVQHREGEMVGPVDLNHEFIRSFDLRCCGDDLKASECSRKLRLLLEIEIAMEDGKGVDAEIDGYWKEIYSVGMYDGWPYWKPMPAVRSSGVLGAEWHFFDSLDAVRLRRPK